MANSKNRAILVLAVGGVICLAVGAVGGFLAGRGMGQARTQESAGDGGQPGEVAVAAKASAIEREYAKNMASGDSEFADKMLLVSGLVDEPTKSADGKYLLTFLPDPMPDGNPISRSHWFVGSVETGIVIVCEFVPSAAQSLSKIKHYDKVAVRGKISKTEFVPGSLGFLYENGPPRRTLVIRVAAASLASHSTQEEWRFNKK